MGWNDLRLDDIRTSLPIETLLWAQRAGSTNDLALLLGRQGELALPALLIAAQQTRGRGRGTNRWWSTEGALTFSLLIEPARYGLVPEQWTRIALASAAAICRTIDELLPEWTGGGRIRWPNDVYVKDRKIAGVLVESVTPRDDGRPTTLRRLVVGIGLNVNNSVRSAPEELRQRATALCDITGQPHDLTDLLIRLLENWFDAIEQLGREPDQLTRYWQERADLVGQLVELQTPGGPVRGLCSGISPAGELLLQTQNGPRRITTGWDVAPSPPAPQG